MFLTLLSSEQTENKEREKKKLFNSSLFLFCQCKWIHASKVTKVTRKMISEKKSKFLLIKFSIFHLCFCADNVHSKLMQFSIFVDNIQWPRNNNERSSNFQTNNEKSKHSSSCLNAWLQRCYFAKQSNFVEAMKIVNNNIFSLIGKKHGLSPSKRAWLILFLNILIQYFFDVLFGSQKALVSLKNEFSKIPN